MKFIDINQLSEVCGDVKRKKFYVDLAAITAVTVEYIDEDHAKDKPHLGVGWMVGVATPLGFVGVPCKDEQEAEQVGSRLIEMIETDRTLPMRAHSATAADMVTKMKNW